MLESPNNNINNYYSNDVSIPVITIIIINSSYPHYYRAPTLLSPALC